jgi:predicted nucleic acid-binding Zn ribbon protein
MEIRHCIYCNNEINFDETWEHDMCKELTLFVIDEMLSKARKKVEILLLKKKELLIEKTI